jgi:Pyridoxamine 5'-phosphate oxidase
MADREPLQVTNLDIYGNAELRWSRACSQLAECLPSPSTPVFLGTTRPDARPHSAGIGALWLDGELYFTSGPTSRKSRNLDANPACTISVRLTDLDLILEGEAARVTDTDILARAAARYREGGWPAEVDGGAFTAPFSAPSAGPPPWHLYRFTPQTAFGVATAEPYGATRWTFGR